MGVSKMAERKCHICCSNQLAYLYRKKGFDIYKCLCCDVQFIDPLPTLEQISDYYSNQYTSFYIRKKRYKMKRAKELVDSFTRVKKPGTLLEIGASAGFVLNEAKKKGWEVYGLDLAEDGIQYAKKEFGIEIMKAHLQDVNFTCGKFDLILMYDVIEHIFYFSKKSIEFLFRQYNFELIYYNRFDIRDILFVRFRKL